MTDPSPDGPVWAPSAVARHLGVAPATLRSWSRRHGIGPPGHRPGRHRRYSAADVAELETMRDLIAQGVVIDSAAAIARSRHRPGPDAPEPGPTPSDGLADLVAAAARLDPTAATGVVRAHLRRHGVVDTWEHLCRPALDRLDDAVSRDVGCADAHLLLSWALSTCLRQHDTPPGPPDGPPVLLAGMPGEQHTLALEALMAALAERRTPARMLGPAVPARALRHAVHRIAPAAIVLWSQRPATARTATLRQVTGRATTVLVGGPGWHRVALPLSVTRVDGLAAALDRLVPAAAAPSPRPPVRTG